MKWLAVHVGGQRWGVHLVSPRSKHLVNDEGTRLVGKCDYDRCRIYISSALDAPAREDTLLHELLHAALYVSGAEEAYGKEHAAEERLVTSITPVLHRLLRDLGFRFPKGPGE
jgi:hypothetical protein